MPLPSGLKNRLCKNLFFLLIKNPFFKTIVRKYRLPTIPQRPEGFETLVLLILEQQVSIDSAKATFLRVKEVAKPFS